MNKNIEMMKKLIEEKKNKGANTKNNMKAQKSIGKASSKGINTGNGGGLFDK
ncbi:hypothetical protein ACEE21_00450 [Clostridium baratii]|uniref:hypothetical protein n=1 Tax=Clostridium baratii TaxID=1561 RepID=UPI001CB2E318|nr:hypothetical protein [Clostridium baratii]MDY3206406.1 hypothetical protein [Clostridium baratii]STA98448.1 Uncharacterised protein [Clostridium baratii]